MSGTTKETYQMLNKLLAGMSDPDKYTALQRMAQYGGLIVSVTWSFDGETLSEQINLQTKEEARENDPDELRAELSRKQAEVEALHEENSQLHERVGVLEIGIVQRDSATEKAIELIRTRP